MSSNDYGLMPGRYPAIVKSYQPARRTCRIEIPGLTDGGDVMPEAEIEYPIGDKAKGGNATEIAILAGDTVWVSFIGGDPRYPIITGYRNPQAGNATDWRRWHHKNLEWLAEAVARIQAGSKATVQAPAIELDTKTGMKGVVQGDCICAFTGAPHGHISATVVAGK